jgi:hypothetical protein
MESGNAGQVPLKAGSWRLLAHSEKSSAPAPVSGDEHEADDINAVDDGPNAGGEAE